MARDHVNNKLNATQYQLTTWSARSWMSYQCQKISIALQRAAAFEIAAELGRVGAVGAGARPVDRPGRPTLRRPIRLTDQ